MRQRACIAGWIQTPGRPGLALIIAACSVALLQDRAHAQVQPAPANDGRFNQSGVWKAYGAESQDTSLEEVFDHLQSEAYVRAAIETPTHAPSAPEVRQLDDANLAIDLPGPPWISVNAKQFNPDADVLLVNGTTAIGVVVIAEPLGVELDVNNKTLSELAKSQIRARAPDAQFLSATDEVVSGMSGTCCTGTATVNGIAQRFIIWTAVVNGYAYQLVILGESQFATQIEEASRNFRQRIRQIDPARTAHIGEQLQSTRFESPHFGYQVDLTGLGWMKWDDVDRKLPGAEFGAVLANRSVMAVLPVPLPGRQPDPDPLTKVLLQRLEFEDEIVRTTAWQLGELKGREVVARRAIGDKDGYFHLRVVADSQRAIFIAGWLADDDAEAIESLRQALDRVTLSTHAMSAEPTVEGAQASGCGLVLNDLGLLSYERGDHLAALDYFSLAFKLDPTNEVVLDNHVAVLSELDRGSEAAALLELHLPRFPDSLKLRALQARMLATQGDFEKARKAYVDLFARGYTDEAALLQYIDLAADAKDYDAGLAAIEAVLQRKPTLQVRRWQASLYGLKGDSAKALELFRQMREQHPHDLAVALDLANVHEHAEDHAAALAITRELLDAGRRDEAIFILHGRNLLRLERSAEAKATFEEALALYPKSESLQDYLKVASNVLGEGDNTLLKTPIEPVEIPTVVCKAIQQASIGRAAAVERYGAEELARVTGIACDPVKPLRTTTFRRIKIHTAGGVSRYSTLTFEFSPSAERLYVNRLIVLDERGIKVAEGSVENYFVVDDNESGIISSKKMVKLPVPGLKPGHTLEYMVTREDLSPSAEFPFQEIVLASGVPSNAGVFFVQGNVKNLKWQTSIPISVEASEDVVYCVHTNMPAFETESRQPSLERFVPIVWIGAAGASWDAAAREYIAQIEGKLAADPQTAQLASELTKHCKSNREKLAAIAAYVQESCTYQAIEFGRRARVPNTAARTLQLKYGDCKDHSVLIKQLLNAVDIPAHLALVNASGPVVTELPSLDQFDHMVAFVPGDAVEQPANVIGGLIIDATEKHADALLFPAYGLVDQSVLVLDPAQPRMVRVPPYPADAGQLTINRQLTISIDSARGGMVNVAVHEDVSFNSYTSPRIRGFLRHFEPGERRQALQDLLAQGDAIRIERLDVQNLEQTGQPLQLAMDYTLPDAFHRVASTGDETLIGNLRSPWERRFFMPEYIDARATPFENRTPVFAQTSMRINLPAGYRLAGLEQCTGSGQSQFAAWASRVSQNDSSISLEYRLRLAAGTHPAQSYPLYYAAMKDSLAPLNAAVTLQKAALEIAQGSATGSPVLR